MDERQWRGTVNAVLYQTQFEPALDDRLVATGAHELVARPLWGQTPEVTLACLRAALASGAPLSTGIPQPHDEASVRSFLTRLVDRLAATQSSWPVLPYRVVPWDDHAEVLEAPAVARVALGWKDAGDRLHTVAQRVEDRYVVMVALSAGDVLAVVNDRDPVSKQAAAQSRLLSGSTRPDLLEDFRTATGFTAEEVTPV